MSKDLKTTIHAKDMWHTMRLRETTADDLTRLSYTHINGEKVESFDDIIRRLVNVADMLHDYIIQKYYPPTGRVPLDEGLSSIYCYLTTPEQMSKDIKEAYEREQAYNYECEQEAQEQMQKDYEDYLKNTTPEQQEKDQQKFKEWAEKERARQAELRKNQPTSTMSFEELFGIKPKEKVA